MEKLHIIPHQHAVGREHRQQLHGHKGLLIWFVGLSGSGKSTLASALEAELFNKGVSTYILDGDNVRAGLNADLTFSAEDRKENIRRIAEVGKLMLDASLVVLTAFISPFEEEREKAKAIIGADRFVEVFVDCPLEECERRDVKGLYAKARAGEISNFTGISSPFEAPTSPDVHIKTSESTPTQGVAELLNFIEKKIQL